MLLPERMSSIRGFRFEDRQEDSVARTHGIRFNVLDMGNGVLRLEEPLIDPLAFIQRDAERHGRYRMSELPEWLFDMVDAASEAMGIYPAPRHHKVMSLAYARPLGSNILQIIGWRHPSFFR